MKQDVWFLVSAHLLPFFFVCQPGFQCPHGDNSVICLTMIVYQLIMKDNNSWKSILNLSLKHFGMLLQLKKKFNLKI